MLKRIITTLFFLSSSLFLLFAQPPRSYTSSEILLQLKKLNTVGSVLYIAAHPDDENTRLITYLANEKCLRTGYLSLTRGDGGQNLIGPEQGVELGVIRTQELLAARRIDGGEQFFTRAYDFGFSKSPEETLSKWNKDSILSDMVWVIRNFRPDIIITRFATDGSGGHGHHTTSAILAEEAFDAAADPTRFPEQLQYVEVWKTRRMFYNATNRFRNPNADMSAFIKLDVGGYNPLLGKSYGEIAAESRSMHKSQGFGSAKQRGESFEYFKPIKGDTAGLKDLFEGIDFTWKRVKGGEKTGAMIAKIMKDYKVDAPEKSISGLIELSNQLSNNSSFDRTSVQNKSKELNDIIVNCDGVFYELTSSKHQYSINDSVVLYHNTIQRNNITSGVNRKDSLLIVGGLKTSQLYWLINPILNDKFQYNFLVTDRKESQPPFIINGGSSININKKISVNLNKPPQYKWTDPEKGELYRPVVITPPVIINMGSGVIVFNDEKAKVVNVTVRAGKDNTTGTLQLEVPSNWKIEPASIAFELLKKGEEKTIQFNITPPATASESVVTAVAQINGERYTKGIKEIKYDHIPVQTLFPEAEAKLVKLDVIKKSKRIGYIPGAGDEVQACLSQLGYEVVILTDDMLAKENLTRFDAIITGVRAYNTNDKLPSFKQKLMDYVNNGGNLIVQYNTNSWAGPMSSDIGPYKFKITRNRVTDEVAKVNFDLPNHPVFNTPNKITDKDFEGWIQERSIYHAGEWDSNYVAPISMADPNEKADKGALLIAKHGKGNFVYTGLVFFRELPAGVPGAYRLLVNMIELGK